MIVAPEPVAELEFEITRDFVFDGLKRDFLQKSLWLLGALMVVSVLSIALMGGGFSAILEPVHLAGFAGAILALIAMLLFKLRRTTTRVLQLFHSQSPSAVFRYQATQEGLRVITDHSTSEYPWADFRCLWCYPDIWLFEIVKNTSVLFPCRSASPEFRRYAVERVGAAGVPIKGSHG